MSCKKICENCSFSFEGYGESSLNYGLRCDLKESPVEEDDTCNSFEVAARFEVGDLRTELSALQEENKKLREALEFYAENEHIGECLEPNLVTLAEGEYNWGSESGKSNIAEKALNEAK